MTDEGKEFFNPNDRFGVNRLNVMSLKWIFMSVIPVVLMGCGCDSHKVALGNAVRVSHAEAAGKKLKVISLVDGAHVRFVSKKQKGFTGAPDISDTSIVLNVAAAFTKDLVTTDVCGDHVVAGERIKGYDDVTSTGHMLILDDKVTIKSNASLDESLEAAVKGKGYLFQQCYIVEDGKGLVERIPKPILDRNSHILYRAACLMEDGVFVIVQGEEEMYPGEFVDALVALGARQALYLDMGTWAWGWVREWDMLPQELTEHFFNTRFQSNWLQVVI